MKSKLIPDYIKANAIIHFNQWGNAACGDESQGDMIRLTISGAKITCHDCMVKFDEYHASKQVRP